MSENNKYSTDGRVVHHMGAESIDEKLAKVLGPKYIEYRKNWMRANKFELITEYPLFVQFDLNQRCNLRCVHCLKSYPEYEQRYYDAQSDVTWALYKRVILESAEYGCPSLSLTGINEPLLMMDLERYIGYARRNDLIDIHHVTNGLLLNEERSKRLLDSGLTRLRFSIDAASPEVYQKIRGVDNYDVLIRNIERFIELKELGNYSLPIVGVNFCRMSLNEHEEEAFKAKWEGAVDSVSIQTYYPLVPAKELNAFYPKKREFVPDEEFRCPQPYQRVVIRNGAVYPCCFFDRRLKIGDLKIDTVYSSWNSLTMHEIRAQHAGGRYSDNKICSKCKGLLYPKL